MMRQISKRNAWIKHRFKFKLLIIVSFLSLCCPLPVAAFQIQVHKIGADQSFDTCRSRADQIQNQISILNEVPGRIQDLQVKDLRSKLNQIWHLHIQVKTLIDSIGKNQGLAAKECLYILYDLLQESRTSAHYIATLISYKQKIHNSFSLPFPTKKQLMLRNYNIKFESLDDLQSGDVVLTRSAGEALTYYSQQGAHYQPLTHASIVYRDLDGSLFVVESAPVGLTASSLKKGSDYFKRDYVNLLFLRHENTNLAGRAAKIAYKLATDFSHRSGHPENYSQNLPYRAALDFKKVDSYPNPEFLQKKNLKRERNNELNMGFSCIEAVRTAFRFSANEMQKINEPKIPFLTDISYVDYIGLQDPKYRNGVEALPINFLEIDYRFEILGEWRDLENVLDVAQRDIIMGAIYKWVLNGDFEFRPGEGPLLSWFKNFLFTDSGAYRFCVKMGLLCKGKRGDLYGLQFFPDNIVGALMNSFFAIRGLKDRVDVIHKGLHNQGLVPLRRTELLKEVERIKQEEIEKLNSCQPSHVFKYLKPKTDPAGCE
jgi:hypothetical protein